MFCFIDNLNLSKVMTMTMSNVLHSEDVFTRRSIDILVDL